MIKLHFKSLIDACPQFQGKKKYQIAQFFGVAPGYWTAIYHGNRLPGRVKAEEFVAKLREAGYPDLKYEDVWCPKEENK